MPVLWSHVMMINLLSPTINELQPANLGNKNTSRGEILRTFLQGVSDAIITWSCDSDKSLYIQQTQLLERTQLGIFL